MKIFEIFLYKAISTIKFIVRKINLLKPSYEIFVFVEFYKILIVGDFGIEIGISISTLHYSWTYLESGEYFLFIYLQGIPRNKASHKIINFAAKVRISKTFITSKLIDLAT